MKKHPPIYQLIVALGENGLVIGEREGGAFKEFSAEEIIERIRGIWGMKTKEQKDAETLDFIDLVSTTTDDAKQKTIKKIVANLIYKSANDVQYLANLLNVK